MLGDGGGGDAGTGGLDGAVDPGVIELPFATDFEDGSQGLWSLTTAGNAFCEVSQTRPYMGNYSLECSGDSGLAALFIAIADTTAIRVEMDINFTTPPPEYLSFVHASRRETLNSHPLGGMSYMDDGSNQAYLKAWSLQETEQAINGNGPIGQNTWIHLDLKLRLEANGLLAFDASGIGPSQLLGDMTPTGAELINRIEIGLAELSIPSDAQRIFIDNVVVSDVF